MNVINIIVFLIIFCYDEIEGFFEYDCSIYYFLGIVVSYLYYWI